MELEEGQTAEVSVESTNDEPVKVEVVAGDDRPVEPEGYMPNYKFKVHDEEHEFDEVLRPVIKDTESEKKIRELYEKAYGLDVVKPKYQKIKEEKSQIEENYYDLVGRVSKLQNYAEQGDLESFFRGLNIDDDKVYKYALEKLKYQDMTPEERKAFDEQTEIRRTNMTLQEKNQMLEQQQRKIKHDQTQNEVASLIQSQDYKPLAEAYDARLGSGAFKEEVWRTGYNHWIQTGEDLQPAKAISIVADRVKKLGITQAANQAANAAQGPSAHNIPTIPNVGSGAGSPARKTFKTFDELRKYADSLGG